MAETSTKTKTLNVRLSPQLKELLDSLKKTLLGKNQASDSEAIRAIIEEFSRKERQEDEELSSDYFGSVSQIERRVLNNESLTHAEVSFLFNCLHKALGAQAASVNTMIDALSFTQALIPLVSISKQEEKDMIGDFGAFKEDSLTKTIDEYKKSLLSDGSSYSRKFSLTPLRPLGRMLSIERRYEINNSDINQAFAPFQATLLLAAKRLVVSDKAFNAEGLLFSSNNPTMGLPVKHKKNGMLVFPVHTLPDYTERAHLPGESFKEFVDHVFKETAHAEYSLTGFLLTINDTIQIGASVLGLEGLWRSTRMRQYEATDCFSDFHFTQLPNEERLLIKGGVRITLTSSEFLSLRELLDELFEGDLTTATAIKSMYGAI